LSDFFPGGHVTPGLPKLAEVQKSKGKPLAKSLIEVGALRTRPITLDQIFSGLAWALIFGITVSTFFTLV
jgi:hypothetical protein